MNSKTLAVPTAQPADGLDNDILAIALQLEELRSKESLDKGKYPEGQPPDATRALQEYQMELATHLQTLTDLKLAQSIAHVVDTDDPDTYGPDTDGPVIANFISIKIQVKEDRKATLQISTDDLGASVQSGAVVQPQPEPNPNPQAHHCRQPHRHRRHRR